MDFTESSERTRRLAEAHSHTIQEMTHTKTNGIHGPSRRARCTHHMKRHELAKKTPVHAASRRMSANSARRAVKTERSEAFMRAR